MRAALQWSYGLLEPQAATLFRRMGVFVGAATLERIERVCEQDDDVLEGLAGLVELSLIRRAGNGRFGMPAALRAFARERLEASGELQALRARHACAVADDLWPAALRQWLVPVAVTEAAVAGDSHELPGLLQWTAENDLELFARILGAAWLSLVQRGALQEWDAPLHRAIAADLPDPLVRAVLHGVVATMAFWHHGTDVIDLSAALTAAAEAGDRTLGASIIASQVCFLAQWSLDDAWHEQTAATIRGFAEDPDPDIRGLAREMEGHAHFAAGRFEAAAIAFEAADPTTRIGSVGLYMAGDAWLGANLHEAALVAYGRGASAARDRGALSDLTFQAEGVAAALAGIGQHEAAHRALGAADVINPRQGPLRDEIPSWGEEVKRLMDPARAALGDRLAEAAYAEGRRLRLDAAIDAILTAADTSVVAA